MGRKTRKELTQSDKPKMTRYADSKPHWLRELLEEGRGAGKEVAGA